MPPTYYDTPISFQNARGSGEAYVELAPNGPRLYAVLGDPDGTLVAPRGSFALDSGWAVAYQNTDGASTWVRSQLPVSPQLLIVDLNGGGNYLSIGAGVTAAAAIATAAAPVAIVVLPGVYYESGNSVVPPHCAVFCPGLHEATIMVALDPNSHGLILSSDSEVHGLQVRGNSGAGYAGFHFPFGITDAEVHDCKTRDCDTGYLSGTAGPSILIRDPHATGGAHTDLFQCSGVGSMFVTGASIADTATITNVFHATGLGSILVANVALIQGALTTRVSLAEDQGQIELQTVHADLCDEGHVAAATGGVLSLGACQLTNTVGDDLTLGNAATVACYLTACYLDPDKFTIGALATLRGNFQSSSALRPGPTTIGELWLGVDAIEQVPLSTYMRETASTGWVSGGVVSTSAGRVLDVGLGVGVVNTGTGVVNVAWTADTVTATANSDFWVYVTSAGVVSIAAAAPNPETNIILATGYADAASIVFVAAHVTPVEHVIVNRHVYTASVIGAVWASGLAVTLPGLLALDVSSGTFWRDEVSTVATGAAPITFTTWYNDGAWVPTTGVAAVPNGQYNTFGVGLGAITAGQWVKHALYVTVGGDGTQYHLVYAQSEQAAQNLAEAAAEPTPPAFLVEDGMVLAGVVIQQGAAAIASRTDRLPQIVTAGPGSAAAPAVHGALGALNVDDHAQYALLTGNAARNAITGTLDLGGGTLLVPLAAAPAQIANGALVWDSDDFLLTIGNGATQQILADTTTAQTLTNKTLTTPTIGDLTNAQHDHSNAANGGTAIAATPSIATQVTATEAAASFANTAATNSDLVLVVAASTAGTTVRIDARYQGYCGGNQSVHCDLTVDGVKIVGSAYSNNGSNNHYSSVATSAHVTLAAGQTVRMRWWVSSGTITVSDRSLSLERMN